MQGVSRGRLPHNRSLRSFAALRKPHTASAAPSETDIRDSPLYRFVLYGRAYPIDRMAGFCLLARPCRGPSCPVTGPFWRGALWPHTVRPGALRRGDRPCGYCPSRNRTGLRFGSVGFHPTDCCLKVVVVTGHSEASWFVSNTQKPVAIKFMVRLRHSVRPQHRASMPNQTSCDDPKPNGPVANSPLQSGPWLNLRATCFHTDALLA